MRLTLLFLAALLLSSSTLSADTIDLKALSQMRQTLTLGDTQWCPYTCQNPDKPGIISEYLTWILDKRDIQLMIITMPWSRAITALQTDQLDGLVTFIEGETNNVTHPRTPTFYIQHCFFTTLDSTWTYTNIDDLANIRLGVAQDYGYDAGVVDEYLNQKHENPMQVQKVNDQNPTKRLFKMANNHRIDAYIDDPIIVDWTQHSLALENAPNRNAGCLAVTPVYVAFATSDDMDIDRLNAWLSEELRKPTSLQKLMSIKQKYLREGGKGDMQITLPSPNYN